MAKQNKKRKLHDREIRIELRLGDTKFTKTFIFPEYATLLLTDEEVAERLEVRVGEIIINLAHDMFMVGD